MTLQTIFSIILAMLYGYIFNVATQQQGPSNTLDNWHQKLEIAAE